MCRVLEFFVSVLLKKTPKHQQKKKKTLSQFFKEMQSCIWYRYENGSILYFKDLVLRILRYEEKKQNFIVE